MRLRIARPIALGKLMVGFLLIVFAVMALLVPRLAQRLRLVESFSAENFALAVLAQNKEVFDRLADM